MLPRAQGLYDPAGEHDACGIGLIGHMEGQASHDIVNDGLRMLARMEHRGARGAEPNTGDGAGILTAIPDAFFRQTFSADLPPPGRYAVGMVFFPRDLKARMACRRVLERYIVEHGQKVLGWRDVPTDAAGAGLGPSALESEPVAQQLFLAARGQVARNSSAFERTLYTLRKQAYHEIKGHGSSGGLGSDAEGYYMCSLSARTLVYKGQLTAEQLPRYFPDLMAPEYTSHLAMVHSRFSTNTFPSWERAQPMRMTCHNGEINTIRGNVNWMRARQGQIDSGVLGDNLERLMPVIDPLTSDSGMLDNVMEFLAMGGRELPEAAMMMIPEAWEKDTPMEVSRRAFYQFHSNLMEPWDGPAAVAFTDGRVLGAILDRNGLRPGRWLLTRDQRVILASETGVLDVPEDQIRRKGRLEPGKMFLVDFGLGRMVVDDEIKARVSGRYPYGKWLASEEHHLSDLPVDVHRLPALLDRKRRRALMRAQAYDREQLRMLLAPMAGQGIEAIGSMGNDAALAVLSRRPRLLYDYFKQLFAQVTNPPIDPIRESLVMSLATAIGPEGSLLEPLPGDCRRIRLDSPLLDRDQLASLRGLVGIGWKVVNLDATFSRPGSGVRSGEVLEQALDRLVKQAGQAVRAGAGLVILSDRRTDATRVAIPTLLAVGCVHQHLVTNRLRTRTALVAETADAREIHHFCTLAGYGVDAIHPWLALEVLCEPEAGGLEEPAETRVRRYLDCAGQGMLKVMSKMGTSTLASYKGAQLFEAVGLGETVIDRGFTGTVSRLKGIGLEELAREALMRHRDGFPDRVMDDDSILPGAGEYHWRAGGEAHGINPETLASLQQAARTNAPEAFRRFSRAVDEDPRQRSTLRGLLRLRQRTDRRVPLAEVESAESIVRRFRTGAMSLGALSSEAHETLAVAMNRVSGLSNSGEGGEDPARFGLMPNGDSARSAIKQVASGRFGVTGYYLANADRLQIKIAQGAKPGEGGQLPGFKVSEEIARIRCSTPGVGLISPPPHHDIYSIEDLSQLIFDLKNANPDASVSVKLVSAAGVGTVAAGVAKAHADHILIAGHDGGTGAAPLTSIKHAGLPWELGLAEAHQTLVLNDLRGRVLLETDGGLRTGRDVIIAACLGAEEFGFSTTPMIAMGCIMMRKCHLNTCPVGICTQDPELRKKFSGTPEHVLNYLFLVAEEVREHMAALGVRSLDEIIGRADLLKATDARDHWKSAALDFSDILLPAQRLRPGAAGRRMVAQDHGLDRVLDQKLIRLCRAPLAGGAPVNLELELTNTDRATGTLLSHQIFTRHGEQGLAEGTIHLNFHGTAGQSLGAWLAPGVTIELVGDANDYVGKGLSGGRIIVRRSSDSRLDNDDPILIGNVALYGATRGGLHVQGMAAERFAVRNSGAVAVVEGVGDHGCEYMTGGRVVVLGPVGRNFAAGMSGGIAWVWDRDGTLAHHCNRDMVDIEPLDQVEGGDDPREWVEAHLRWTGSGRARYLLDHWEDERHRFWRIMPHDYRRVLESEQASRVIPLQKAREVTDGH